MYTQCPECLSVFSLDVQALAQAHGYVVCGHCQTGFDSLATLTGQLPAEAFVELPLNDAELEPPQIERVFYHPLPETPVAATADGPADPTDSADPADPADPADDFSTLVFAPRFARERRGSRGRRAVRAPSRPSERRWPWVMACMTLSLLLGLQLTWAERDTLIQNPLIGHWLRSSCTVLGCSLPLVSAPGEIRLMASNVQAHPSVPGALMISASVRNDAAFAQPWPVVDVTLSDADGHPVGMRRLQPGEYLDDGRALQRGLAPGATAVLVLELEDPGKNAVAFEFAFE